MSTSAEQVLAMGDGLKMIGIAASSVLAQVIPLIAKQTDSSQDMMGTESLATPAIDLAITSFPGSSSPDVAAISAAGVDVTPESFQNLGLDRARGDSNLGTAMRSPAGIVHPAPPSRHIGFCTGWNGADSGSKLNWHRGLAFLGDMQRASDLVPLPIIMP